MERKREIKREIERVDGKLGLPKHDKMAGNPFVFLRGSGQLFYRDLAEGVIPLPEALAQWPLTTVMGDCHLSNFGFFTEEGSHGDRVIFSPNDFDDACIGHAGWDLLRFAVSVILCRDYAEGMLNGRYAPVADADGPCVSNAQVDKALKAFLKGYKKVCKKSVKDPEYRHTALDRFKKSRLMVKAWHKASARAPDGEDFERKSSLAKAVDLTETPLRFRDRPERFQKLDAARKAHFKKLFAPYVDDDIVDIVERVNAGTGSVNLSRYYLLVGPGEAPEPSQRPLYHIVEIKQQRQAAPLHYFPDLSPNNELSPAHLTVHCQQRMVRVPDLVLDHLVWDETDWLVRSRHHARVGLDPEDVALGKKAVKGGFVHYAQTCGRALALAHIRGDRRSTAFERAVLDDFDQTAPALVEVARGYARQVMADCQMLSDTLESL